MSQYNIYSVLTVHVPSQVETFFLQSIIFLILASDPQQYSTNLNRDTKWNLYFHNSSFT